MLDDFFSLVRDSWQKTQGEKALIWRGYGLAILVASIVFLIPVFVLITYFHFSLETPTFNAVSNAALIVTLLVVVALIGILYSLFLFSALPYLSLRYLRQDPLSASLAARKALVHKWPLFANWFLFFIIYGVIHRVFKSMLACDQCIFINTCLFTLFHLILVLSIFEILDKNETPFNAFIKGWQFFIQNFVFCLLVVLWILCLSIFSVATLGIGSIWAVPAQYNAMALLYERVRKC